MASITANTSRTWDRSGRPYNLVVESVSLRGREGGASRGGVAFVFAENQWGAVSPVSPHSVASAVTAKWARGSGGPAGDEVQNLVPVHIPEAIGTLGTAAVRRLTPRECERLQGFPDDWTSGQPDSHRYRQLGNAVAVPVAEWIGRRIVEVLE